MRQIRRHTSTPFPRIFLKNPARWAEPPGQARTRSPSQFPGHTAIGTKALGLLFLRRKVASGYGQTFYGGGPKVVFDDSGSQIGFDNCASALFTHWESLLTKLTSPGSP